MRLKEGVGLAGLRMNRVTYWIAYGYICLGLGAGGSWILETTDKNWVMYTFFMLACVLCLGIIDGDKE